MVELRPILLTIGCWLQPRGWLRDEPRWAPSKIDFSHLSG